jgi:hypothetical protein
MDFEKYKRRMTRNGNQDVGDAYNNNTIAFIEATFSSSPTFRVLDVVSTEFPNMKKIDARVVEVERLGNLREIYFRPNQGLNLGTYVKFDGETWLIFDVWGSTKTRMYVMAQKCNRTLKWSNYKVYKNADGTVDNSKVYEFDCIASASPLGSKANQSKMEIEYNKYDVELPNAQLYAYVEANASTRTIRIDQRFIFGINVYEVVGIDDTTAIDKNGFGVLQMTLQVATKQMERDDFTNRIGHNPFAIDNTPTPPPTDDGEDEGGILW